MTPEEQAAKDAADAKLAQEAAAAAKKDELIEIKVNGATQKLSQEQLIKLAEKSAGADAKFMEAAELKKEAVKGLRIEQLYSTISSAESVEKVEAEARELAGLLNLKPEEFISSLKDDSSDTARRTSAEAKVELSAEDKQVLGYARQMMYDGQIKVLKDSIEQGIDTEPHCVKMISDLAGDNAELAKELKSELLDQTFKDVQRRVTSQEQTDLNTIVSSSLQEVRGRLERNVKRFGTPSTATSGVPVLPLGQPDSISAKAYAKEPVKRVSSAEPDFEDNFAARVVQRAIKMGKSIVG